MKYFTANSSPILCQEIHIVAGLYSLGNNVAQGVTVLTPHQVEDRVKSPPSVMMEYIWFSSV